MITDMITQTKAARLLCLNAAFLKDVNDPSAIRETLIAKYYSSSILKDITNDAVQIHGANGCSDQYPVARLYRDAKVMEIIEGSSQMQQITIAKYGFQEYKPAVENA
jgi:alkylation response protein AidB-like acyl-CoA dehydrogenase